MKNFIEKIVNAPEKSLDTYIGKALFVFTFCFLGCLAAIWVYSSVLNSPTNEPKMLWEPETYVAQGIACDDDMSPNKGIVPQGDSVYVSDYEITCTAYRNILFEGEYIGFDKSASEKTMDEVLATEEKKSLLLAQAEGVLVFYSEVKEEDKLCGGDNYLSVYYKEAEGSISSTSLMYDEATKFNITYGNLRLDFSNLNLKITRVNDGKVAYQGKLKL